MGARAFVLVRDTDVSGISGTGIVAEGVEFSDGTVALRWLSAWPTSVVFHDRGIEAVQAVHGHSGATRIQWADAEPAPMVKQHAFKRLDYPGGKDGLCGRPNADGSLCLAEQSDSVHMTPRLAPEIHRHLHGHTGPPETCPCQRRGSGGNNPGGGDE